MNAKQLKDLINAIPDDAEIRISGADIGGYDITYDCGRALHLLDNNNIHLIVGFDNDQFENARRLENTIDGNTLIGDTQ